MNLSCGRVNVCIHDTTGYQTGLTTGCIMQPVVSCTQTFTRLSNWFENRLYRVNGALHTLLHK